MECYILLNIVSQIEFNLKKWFGMSRASAEREARHAPEARPAKLGAGGRVRSQAPYREVSGFLVMRSRVCKPALPR